MKKVLGLSLLLSIFFFQLDAQVSTEKNPRPKRVYNGPSGHALGAVLSSSNGKGLAYRYWPQNVGFHLAFIPAANNDSKYYNAGITGYLTIREYEIGKLFLHVGAEYQYTSKKEYFSNGYPTYSSGQYLDKANGFNIGAGPGLHVFQKYVSMDLFIGYGAYFKTHTYTLDGKMPRDETVVTLTGGIAFFLEL